MLKKLLTTNYFVYLSYYCCVDFLKKLTNTLLDLIVVFITKKKEKCFVGN